MKKTIIILLAFLIGFVSGAFTLGQDRDAAEPMVAATENSDESDDSDEVEASYYKCKYPMRMDEIHVHGTSVKYYIQPHTNTVYAVNFLKREFLRL